MRRLLVLLLVAPIALAACGGDDTPVATDGPSTSTDVASPTGTYLSVSVTENGEPRPLAADTVIRLTLADDGTIGADLGCNSIGGTYSIDDGALVLGDGLAMTEMGCDPERHAQDEWFADLLQAGPAVTVDGDTLVLATGTTTVTLRERSVVDPDRPLVGTRWTVTGFVDGDVAMSMTIQEPGVLEFTDDGWVTGSDGCNGFGYGTSSDGSEPDIGLRYEVDGNRIVFSGDPVSTLVACPDTEDYQARYRAVLQGTVEYEITADALTIVAPDGRGVTYRASE